MPVTAVNAYKQDLEDKSTAAIKAISELKQAADALAARLEQDYTAEPEVPENTKEDSSQPDNPPSNEGEDSDQTGPRVDKPEEDKLK